MTGGPFAALAAVVALGVTGGGFAVAKPLCPAPSEEEIAQATADDYARIEAGLAINRAAMAGNAYCPSSGNLETAPSEDCARAVIARVGRAAIRELRTTSREGHLDAARECLQAAVDLVDPRDPQDSLLPALGRSVIGEIEVARASISEAEIERLARVMLYDIRNKRARMFETEWLGSTSDSDKPRGKLDSLLAEIATASLSVDETGAAVKEAIAAMQRQQEDRCDLHEGGCGEAGIACLGAPQSLVDYVTSGDGTFRQRVREFCTAAQKAGLVTPAETALTELTRDEVSAFLSDDENPPDRNRVVASLRASSGDDSVLRYEGARKRGEDAALDESCRLADAVARFRMEDERLRKDPRRYALYLLYLDSRGLLGSYEDLVKAARTSGQRPEDCSPQQDGGPQ